MGVVRFCYSMGRVSCFDPGMERRGFEFEKLDVYHVAMEYYSLARKIAKALPFDFAEERQQLTRAALSIVLNICEATGEFSRKEQSRFFRMSLRSSCECAGLNKIFLQHLGARSDLHQANDLLLRAVAMLTGLIKHNTP